MPQKGETLSFTNRRQQYPVPFFIVADCETLNESITTVFPDPTKSNTTSYARLTPCSAGYKIVSVDDGYYSPTKIFFGKNCMEKFLDSMTKDVKDIKKILENRLEMNLSPEEENQFQNAVKCHICEKK